MIETVRLAGYLASQAILWVSQGKSLTVPLLVLEKEGSGFPQFIQLKEGTTEAGVEKAGEILSNPPPGVVRAVLAFEAYLNLPPGKTDAIFMQACQYKPEPKQVHLAVPYRAPTHPKGFAVFRPKFIAYEDDCPSGDLLAAFLQATALHPEGHAVWVRHLDESR